MHHHELKLDSNKANLTAEGHRLDNFPIASMPWHPCTDLCFFQLNINYEVTISPENGSASMIFTLREPENGYASV